MRENKRKAATKKANARISDERAERAIKRKENGEKIKALENY